MNRVFPRIELLVTPGVAALAMGAVPAEAQTGPQTSSLVAAAALQEPEMPHEPQRNEEARPLGPVSETIGQEIVVNGSFIQGSAENAALPIDVIGVEELADRGIPSILDLLKAMPSSSGAVGDTNLISSAAIGRVEVLKDGASALYGSDAIAGVVNFMTRTDQRGLALAGEFRVIDGPEGDWLLSSSYGNQFGNLNVFLSGGYQRRSPLQAIKRDCTWVTFLENPNGGYTPIGNPGTYAPLGANFSAIGAPRREVNCASLNGFPGFTGKTPAYYSQTSWPVLPNLA